MRIDNPGAVGHARSSGQTVVHFYCGGEVANATVTVQPAENPIKLVLEPAESTIGIATTAAFRVYGEYKDRPKVELTDAVEWSVTPQEIVYCERGRVEGKSAGEATVEARFHANPADAAVTAEAKVTVADEAYNFLTLAVKPAELAEGKTSQLEAAVTTKSGQAQSVLGSSRLKWEVEPEGLAVVEKGHLRARQLGTGTLKATYDKLKASAGLKVKAEGPQAPFEPRPKLLRLAVGEVGEIQVPTSGGDPIRLSSSAPGIVEVVPGPGCRVAGRGGKGRDHGQPGGPAGRGRRRGDRRGSEVDPFHAGAGFRAGGGVGRVVPGGRWRQGPEDRACPREDHLGDGAHARVCRPRPEDVQVQGRRADRRHAPGAGGPRRRVGAPSARWWSRPRRRRKSS